MVSFASARSFWVGLKPKPKPHLFSGKLIGSIDFAKHMGNIYGLWAD